MADRTDAGTTTVRRITVDEKVAEDLLRLLVCNLNKNVNEFLPLVRDWEEEGRLWGNEREIWATPSDYADKLGTPEPPAWEELKEGQVYISGAFGMTGDPKAPELLKRSPLQRSFLRIDNIREFKDGVKQLYSQALTGRLTRD